MDYNNTDDKQQNQQQNQKPNITTLLTYINLCYKYYPLEITYNSMKVSIKQIDQTVFDGIFMGDCTGDILLTNLCFIKLRG